MEDSHTQWILTAPVLISMVASTVFLVNVVRILLTKLHSASANPAPVGIRKAVRATLILVPLFGIHHILFPFRPEPGQYGEKIYQIFSAVVVSLQVRMASELYNLLFIHAYKYVSEYWEVKTRLNEPKRNNDIFSKPELQKYAM
jgi:calcitonin receptor-like